MSGKTTEETYYLMRVGARTFAIIQHQRGIWFWHQTNLRESSATHGPFSRKRDAISDIERRVERKRTLRRKAREET
jgi:hypothetical protein